MRWHFLLLLPALLLWSEIAVAQNDSLPGIWIEQEFSGGEQCIPEEDVRMFPERYPDQYYEPDSALALLRRLKIDVLEDKAFHLPVCEACSCPNYSVIHYFRIPSRHKKAALKAGFRLSR